MLCNFVSFSWLSLVILYIKYLLLGGVVSQEGHCLLPQIHSLPHSLNHMCLPPLQRVWHAQVTPLKVRYFPTPNDLPAAACQTAAGAPIDHSILDTVLQGHMATAEHCTVGCSSAPGSCCFACNLDVSHWVSWLWRPLSPFRAAKRVLCMLLLDQSLTLIFDRMRFP